MSRTTDLTAAIAAIDFGPLDVPSEVINSSENSDETDLMTFECPDDLMNSPAGSYPDFVVYDRRSPTPLGHQATVSDSDLLPQVVDLEVGLDAYSQRVEEGVCKAHQVSGSEADVELQTHRTDSQNADQDVGLPDSQPGPSSTLAGSKNLAFVPLCDPLAAPDNSSTRTLAPRSPDRLIESTSTLDRISPHDSGSGQSPDHVPARFTSDPTLESELDPKAESDLKISSEMIDDLPIESTPQARSVGSKESNPSIKIHLPSPPTEPLIPTRVTHKKGTSSSGSTMSRSRSMSRMFFRSFNRKDLSQIEELPKPISTSIPPTTNTNTNTTPATNTTTTTTHPLEAPDTTTVRDDRPIPTSTFSQSVNKKRSMSILRRKPILPWSHRLTEEPVPALPNQRSREPSNSTKPSRRTDLSSSAETSPGSLTSEKVLHADLQAHPNSQLKMMKDSSDHEKWITKGSKERSTDLLQKTIIKYVSF